MKVRSDTEYLAAVQVVDSRYTRQSQRFDTCELRQFSVLRDYVPGDLLVYDTRTKEVAGMMRTRNVFLVEVHFSLDVDESLLAEKARTWGMSTDVAITTGVTIRAVSSSHQWITDTIKADPDVKEVFLLRAPKGET